MVRRAATRDDTVPPERRTVLPVRVERGLMLATAAWLLLAAGTVSAQTPATPEVPPPPLGPDAPPEQIEPDRPIGGPDSGATLSDQLSKSDGVITPPKGVDPGMVQPPPPDAAGTMPIIPPPGSPGGDPTIRPK